MEAGVLVEDVAGVGDFGVEAAAGVCLGAHAVGGVVVGGEDGFSRVGDFAHRAEVVGGVEVVGVGGSGAARFALAGVVVDSVGGSRTAADPFLDERGPVPEEVAGGSGGPTAAGRRFLGHLVAAIVGVVGELGAAEAGYLDGGEAVDLVPLEFGLGHTREFLERHAAVAVVFERPAAGGSEDAVGGVGVGRRGSADGLGQAVVGGVVGVGVVRRRGGLGGGFEPVELVVACGSGHRERAVVGGVGRRGSSEPFTKNDGPIHLPSPSLVTTPTTASLSETTLRATTRTFKTVIQNSHNQKIS